jgi:hypothetical protein
MVIGVNRSMLAINGQFPGPVIRANEGDRIIVNVTNELSEPTTMHWHGLYQNGTNWMDGSTSITQVSFQLELNPMVDMQTSNCRWKSLTITTVPYTCRENLSLQFYDTRTVWNLLVSFTLFNSVHRWCSWAPHYPFSR